MSAPLHGVLLVYLVELKAPLLVRARRHRAGFEPLRDRIPATTLGGALAAAGIASRADLASGRAFVSDAYPVAGQSCEPSMPAPGVCVEVKRGAPSLHRSLEPLDGGVACFTQAASASDPARVVVDSLATISEKLGFSVEGLTKRVVGAPVTCSGPRLVAGVRLLSCRRVEVAGAWRDSVSMSYRRRRSEEGMLYSYEAVDHRLWWGVARLPGEAVKALEKGVDVRLGGGRSRGFGEAEVRALPLDPGDYSRVAGGGGGWYMLWTPLPLTPGMRPPRAAPPVTIELSSWGSRGARPTLKALAPGVLVDPGDGGPGPLQARFAGLSPPHGSAEPLPPGRLPPSLEAARPLLARLCRG